MISVYALWNTQCRGRHPAVDPRLMSVMHFPGYGIEHTCQAVFCDTSTKERVRGESAKGVVTNLRIRGGGPLADKVEIDVGAQGRRIEQG